MKLTVEQTGAKKYGRQRAARSSLYITYLLLAAFNLLAVSSGLYFNHRLMSIYIGSISRGNDGQIQQKIITTDVASAVFLENYGLIFGASIFALVCVTLIYGLKMKRQMDAGEKILETEIVEREEAEQALREGEERYKGLAETAFNGYVLHQDGIIKDVNRAYAEMYGYTPEELKGRHILNMTPQPERERVGSNIANAVEKPYETLGLKKDGTLVNIEVSAKNCSYEGRPARLAAVRDLTERKRAEEVLRRAEEKYHSIFENAVEGIFQSTPGGRFITVNPALARMYGYDSPEEMIRERTDIELQHYVNPQRRADFTRLLAQHDIVHDFESEVFHKNGSILWTSESVRAVRDGAGELLYYEGMVEDITERKRVVQALRENEERYRELVENANDIIYTHDLMGRLTSLNRAGERITGYTREEALRTNIGDVIAPEYMTQVRQRIAEKVTGGGLDASELDVIAKDGGRIALEVTSRSILQDGVAVGIQGIARDVTERKRAEEALRRSEKYFRSLIENASDVISIVNKDGVRRYISPSVERVLGYRPEELVGQKTFGMVHLEDAPELIKLFTKVLQSPRITMTREVRCQHKDGSWRTLEATASNLLDDPIVAGVIINSRDITKRKRVQEELRVSEESYRRLVELSPDTILVHCEGKIVYVNPAGLKFLGATSPEQIVGKPVLDIVCPDFRELVKKRIQSSLEGKKASLVEEKILRLDGQVIDAEVTGVGFTYQGKLASLVIARDITERLQTREAHIKLQLRLLAAQEEERHHISRELHDQMGQHLPALMLGLKALKDTVQSGQSGLPTVERLQQLQDLAERIARDAHTLARDLRPAALDEFGLPSALSNYLQEWSQRCGITVDFHSTGFEEGKRLPPHVEITLYRTVQEALTNVVKHAQAEHVILILKLSRQDVLVVVEDDGKGFDVEAVMNTPISERRLGLLGMQERVGLVGGKLEIESAPGAGTTVATRINALTP